LAWYYRITTLGLFQVRFSKEARFSKTVVPPTQRIGPSATDNNMIQQREIHHRRSLTALPRELDSYHVT